MLERTTGQELQVTPAKALVFALTNVNHLLDPTSVAIVREHPKAVQDALALAYYRFDLFNIDPRIKLDSELQDIRRDFPTVTTQITDRVISELLQDHPVMRVRLDNERGLFEALPEEIRAGIKDSEILLKLLIEDGGNRNLNIDDYRNVKASHTLFGELEDQLTQDRVILTGEELDKFTEIGQRLLITSRIFEVNTEEIDTEYSSIGGEEQDYRGILSQMSMLTKIIAAISSSKDTALTKKADQYKADMQHLFDTAFMRHPGKIADLSKRYSRFVGISDFAWAEHPGGPDFQKSEEINFSHGGND